MINTVNEVDFVKTKFGLIPRDWKYDFIENYAIRGSGHTPNKKISSYYNGGIKWVSLADSKRLDNLFIKETEIEISKEGIDNSSAVLHPKGTVLVSRDAGVGKSAIMQEDMAVSQHFIVWKCGEELNNIYLYYFLQYQKPLFERMAIGSTIKTIGLSFFKKYKVVLPPLLEQQKIATIFFTWDKAIDLTQQLIAAKEEQKKGLMQRLLTGKIRVNGYNGEWKKYRLKDLTERITRKNEELNDNVVTISAQRGFIKQEEFFNKRVASSILSNYYLLDKGDFCYNKSYSNGYPMGAFKRLDDYEKAVVTTLYICFRLKLEKVSSNFVLNYFEGGRMIKGLMRIAQEGGRAHGLLNIGLKDFFDLEMTLPKIQEQTAIAEVLSSADNEIKLLKEKLDAFKEQKKGLMQRLLTGKIRVNSNYKIIP